MIKITESRFAAAFLGLLLYGHAAHAMDFTEYGIVNLSYPSIQSSSDPSYQTTAGFGIGLGLSAGFALTERIDIEPAILYVPRSFSVTNANSPRTSYNLTSTHIPIVVRYWLNPNFSIGVGPYLAHASGNIVITQGSHVSTVGYGNLSWAQDDVGFLASFRYRSKINELMSLILDARLVLGTSNLDQTEKQSYYNRDIQTLVGISFIL